MWGMTMPDDNGPDARRAQLPIPPDQPGTPQPGRPVPEPAHGPSQPPPAIDPPLPGETIPPAGDPPQEQPLRQKEVAKEVGGPSGPEPTRYGDWERKGRVSDF
ncbi:MAG: hypothetical protein RLZZ187_332 [Pseudomonadota bacterium]